MLGLHAQYALRSEEVMATATSTSGATAYALVCLEETAWFRAQSMLLWFATATTAAGY